MGTNSDAAAERPDPEKQKLADAKAKFEAAVKKTKIQEGLIAPDPEPKADAPGPATATEVVAAKPKAPKPDPLKALQDQVAALTARLEEKAKQKPEEDEDPVEEIRGRLSERFGEEEAQDLIDQLHTPLAKRLEQLETVLREATQRGQANVSKANQKRLSKDHPQLKSPEAWAVLEGAVRAAFEKDPKAYESVEDAFDAKALALYGAPEEEAQVEDDAADEETEVEASRIAAASLTAPGKAPRKETRSREERAKEHLAYIIKHPDDKAGHKRLARELGLIR